MAKTLDSGLLGNPPQHHRPVVAARDEAIGQPKQAIHRIDMAAMPNRVHHFQELKSLRVPDFQRFIAAGGGKEFSVGREYDVIQSEQMRGLRRGEG